MIIRRLEVFGNFRYLWLKTVEDVDLSVHCARCLIGKYDDRIKPFKGITNDLELEDKVYYLCGVTNPYRWADNFHLAFKPCKGKVVSVREHGVEVEILDAVRINITPEYIDDADEHRNVRAYCTCRNWQFAHMFKKKVY